MFTRGGLEIQALLFDCKFLTLRSQAVKAVLQPQSLVLFLPGETLLTSDDLSPISAV